MWLIKKGNISDVHFHYEFYFQLWMQPLAMFITKIVAEKWWSKKKAKLKQNTTRWFLFHFGVAIVVVFRSWSVKLHKISGIRSLGAWIHFHQFYGAVSFHHMEIFSRNSKCSSALFSPSASIWSACFWACFLYVFVCFCVPLLFRRQSTRNEIWVWRLVLCSRWKRAHSTFRCSYYVIFGGDQMIKLDLCVKSWEHFCVCLCNKWLSMWMWFL